MNPSLKLLNIISDIYNNHVSRNTVDLAKSLESEPNREIWRSVSAVRYLAGADQRNDFQNIAQEARLEIEDDLIYQNGSWGEIIQ